MEQHVEALIQQVVDMSERMRQSEDAAEQARQLMEAHRNAGQMLEERLHRAEATATAPRADDGRFGCGAFAARYQPESFSGEDTAWRDWSTFFRTSAGRVQEVIRAMEARP